MTHNARRRKEEGGFAMLLVFALAAVIVIGLYKAAPRYVFEAERQKEQLLVDRGEQFIRGVQVYTRKLKKLPQSIDDLEKTNDIRFLRKKYVDPFTGKDEWRLIHAGPGGQLTDSLVKKLPDPNAPGATQSASNLPENPSMINGPTTGGTYDPNLGGAAPAWARGRQSDAQGAPGQIGAPGQPAGQPPNQAQYQSYQTGSQPSPYGYPQQGAQPGQINLPPGLPGQPGYQAPGSLPPGYQQPYQPNYPPGLPGAPRSFTPPGIVPSQQPQPNQYGTPATGYPTTGSGYGQPQIVQPRNPYPDTTTGSNGNSYAAFGRGGQQPPQPQLPSSVAGVINNLLTQPRAGGLPGQQGGASQIGAGIVGIASKHEAEGIKIYNERTNIKEWEFVYDPQKDKSMAKGGQPGMPGGPGTQQQPPSLLSPGQPPQPLGPFGPR